MSTEDTMAAAVRLAYAAIAAQEDKTAGRDYRDIIAAMVGDVEALYADGRDVATLTLLRLTTISIEMAALAAGKKRRRMAETVLNYALAMHAPGEPPIGLDR